MISLTENRRMLEYGLLGSYSNISHFVTTRYGGCSEGTYASFNCSPYSGDEADKVGLNQDILCKELGSSLRQLVIPYQTHATTVFVVNNEFIEASAKRQQEMLYGVDALITRQPGYCLCVSTADCVPILLYDKKQKAIAAVHGGWRGTVAFIAGHTLEKMRAAFGTEGRDVIACIGPSISLASFEVGEEVYEAFRLNGFDMSRISVWKKETGKHHIDLWEANRMQLLDFGVPDSQIEVAGICTYIYHDDFFSARRLGIKSGRILSGIMLKE